MPEQFEGGNASSNQSTNKFGDFTVDDQAAPEANADAGDNLDYKVTNPTPNLVVLCKDLCIPTHISDEGNQDTLSFTNDIFDNTDRNDNNELSKAELGAFSKGLGDLSKKQTSELKDGKADEFERSDEERAASINRVDNYKNMTDLVIDSFDDVRALDNTDGKEGANAEGITKKDLEAVDKLRKKDPEKLTDKEKELLNKLDNKKEDNKIETKKEADGKDEKSKKKGTSVFGF